MQLTKDEHAMLEVFSSLTECQKYTILLMMTVVIEAKSGSSA
jgi:hypothetical protein